MRNDSKGFSRAAIFLMVLGVLVLAAAAASYGVYVWRNREVNRLNDKVSSLNTQISSLNSQITSMSQSLSKACNQQTSNTVCTRYDYSSQKGVQVYVYAPEKNTTIKSPVAVVGEVPGSWSFEAQFPVLLQDSKGTVIARATGHVLGDWQTSQLVPFSAQLTYAGSYSGNGALILQKDNPSGLEKNADSVTIPIKLQ